MNENKLLCIVCGFTTLLLTLCAGEPDLLDAITNRVGGFKPADTNAVLQIERIDRRIATYDTNFMIIGQAFQRHEAMLQSLLSTNQGK